MPFSTFSSSNFM
ncbi:BgTH12-06791 [Blumeria graminis f. sp. triticale]|uniref:BgTH12-06791 n=1 Tax=Blumeria graminis f. sp. triticale TaxID=1689686 RepID=A0A9W4D355_BLUGR|nr:BgTH12-06791 [Blumeria graminis f. sp. triticale]